jgi:hypothetical protein
MQSVPNFKGADKMICDFLVPSPRFAVLADRIPCPFYSVSTETFAASRLLAEPVA